MPIEVYNTKKNEGKDLIKKWNLWYFPVIVVIDTTYKSKKRKRSQNQSLNEWKDERRDEIHASTIEKYPDYVWEKLKRMARNDFTWKDLYDKYRKKE